MKRKPGVQPSAPSSSPRSRQGHPQPPLAGLDRHGVRALEGWLEGLTRAAANERPHLEAVLELRLKVRRLAERRLRGNEGRLLGAIQEQRRLVGERDLRVIQWWCLAVECCGRGEDSATEFRIRYCHGRAPSPRTSRERRADPGLG